MKKKMFALLAALVLTFAFATTSFAAPSPTETPAPTEDPSGYVDPEPYSPQTGVPIAGALIAAISSAGLAIVAKKEMK